MRILIHTISPKLAHYSTLAMSLVFMAIALPLQSVLLFIFAALSAQSAFSSLHSESRQRSLKPWQALFGLGAYLAMLASFGLGGIQMIMRYFL